MTLCDRPAPASRQNRARKTLSDPGTEPAAERFWEGLRNGAAEIEPVSAADLAVAWAAGEAFPDQDFSVVYRTWQSGAWSSAAAREWWQSHLPELTGPLTLTDTPVPSAIPGPMAAAGGGQPARSGPPSGG